MRMSDAGNPYLNEALNEALGQRRLRLLLRSEVLQHVRELLPVVECLLQVTKSRVSMLCTVSPLPSPFPLYCSWCPRPASRERTWNSWWLLKSSTSTVFSCDTKRCLSNSCRILVRIAETGMSREYICWISGDCYAPPSVPFLLLLHIYPSICHSKLLW
jgi:hypothetical protein